MDLGLYEETELISVVTPSHEETSHILADGLDGDKDGIYEVEGILDFHITTGWAFLEAKVNAIVDVVDTWFTYAGYRGDVSDHYAQGTNSYDGLALACLKSAAGFAGFRSIICAKTGRYRQCLSRAFWGSNPTSGVIYYHQVSSVLKESASNITKLTLMVEGGSGIHFAGTGEVRLYRIK
jgi:hypothetical protein